MSVMTEFSMKLAGREWARQFYTAVVKSFAKTVTEPITNSDTSYKRKHALADASGLIDGALKMEKGRKFDLSEIKQALKRPGEERVIEIHLFTAQGHGRKPRTCDLVDHAEGLSQEELASVFRELAADKSDVSKGRPGRSLFGRGVSDVLLGHKDGTFYSYRDGILSKAEFIFDHKKDSEPKIRVTSNKNPSAAELKDIHLHKLENGTCVRFTLHEDCRLPDEGTLIPILSQFYMLRLINADPNVRVRVVRYRSANKILEDTLEYDFPIGDVVEKLSFSIPNPTTDKKLPTIQVEGIVCRAEAKGGLPGKDAGEQRANGLLMVDDKDAVLDLTFLPQYEGAPYLANIYGVVRLANVREVLSWYLNNGKDSPLTVTRDGFDTKHEFTKLLFQELCKRLEPVYKKEEQRFNKSFSTEISEQARERINDALKELNKFLRQIGDGEGEEPPPSGPEVPTEALQFIPETVKLKVSAERVVKLFLRKSEARPAGLIIYDSSNPLIVVTPVSHQIGDGRVSGDYLVYQVSVKCDALHESGKITALAEGVQGELEAHLSVSDVTSGLMIIPPDEMEFRPKEARGQPSRCNNIALYVNATRIPLGRKIRLEIEKSHGAIGFLQREKIVQLVATVFEKAHLLENTNTGRILIPWKGSGWGQAAKIIAETKKPDGSLVHTEGRIVLEQPDESGGMIKDVKYMPLENQKCSDLVDGIIYINSNHYLNRIVFGNPEEYKMRIDKDRTAQYKFSELIVEQSVFRLAEDCYRNNKLILSSDAPVTSLREFVDKKTHQLAPKITKVFITR